MKRKMRIATGEQAKGIIRDLFEGVENGVLPEAILSAPRNNPVEIKVSTGTVVKVTLAVIATVFAVRVISRAVAPIAREFNDRARAENERRARGEN